MTSSPTPGFEPEVLPLQATEIPAFLSVCYPEVVVSSRFGEYLAARGVYLPAQREVWFARLNEIIVAAIRAYQTNDPASSWTEASLQRIVDNFNALARESNMWVYQVFQLVAPQRASARADSVWFEDDETVWTRTDSFWEEARDEMETETIDYRTPEGTVLIATWLLDHYHAAGRSHWLVARNEAGILDRSSIEEYFAIWHDSAYQAEALAQCTDDTPRAGEILASKESFLASLEALTYKEALHRLLTEPVVLDTFDRAAFAVEVGLIRESMQTLARWYTPADRLSLKKLEAFCPI